MLRPTAIYRLAEEGEEGEPQQSADMLKGSFREVAKKFALRQMKGYRFYSDGSTQLVAKAPPTWGWFYPLNDVPDGIVFEFNRVSKLLRILRFGEVMSTVRVGE